MSLSYLRDAVIKDLRDKADAASTRAINCHPSSHLSADTYAMQQIDALSEARAYLYAIGIVNAAYKLMTDPDKPEDKVEQAEQNKPPQEPIY